MRERAPLIGLTAGDPAGIGPELARRALEERALEGAPRLLVLGPAALRPAGVPRVGPDDDLDALERGWLETPAEGDWTMGRAQASAGRAALEALRAGAALARAGRVDALVSGPVSKEALHLAGERVEGQTQLLERWEGVEAQMLGCADRLRVLLLTRHVPLAHAIAAVTTEAVERHLGLLARGLASLGFAAPRLALAGLNPHAGEKGLLGGEEQALLEPAVARARAAGLDVAGPLPPDTVFLRCAKGEFDAVLALYHDQAFIPLKLHAPERAFTVLLGLPWLRLSPAHGTAFDIAGRGLARPDCLFATLAEAARFARARQRAG